MRISHLAIGSIFVMTLASTNLWAAKINKVKGKNVLISMQASEFAVGDVLKVENTNGKTTGIIKVLKVKGRYAQGILKGKAKTGLTVVLRNKSGSNKQRTAKIDDTDHASDSSGPNQTSGSSFWGLMAGVNSTSAEVTTTANTTVELKDMAYSLLGFMDFTLMPQLGIRAMAGLEQFEVTGNTSCGGECSASITYLALDAWARYLLSDGAYRPWVGAGFYMLFPMAKDATALNDSSITNTSVFAFGGGLDIMLSDSSMIPIQIEYDLYPSSDTVKASAIAGRVGYGVSF